MTRKAAAAGPVPGASLRGGLEKPLHEAVKEKPGLPSRLRDVGNSEAMGHPLKTAANRGGTSPKERSVLQSTKLKGVGDLKSTLT